MFCEFNPSEVDDAIENGTVLGRGAYGSVYKAKIRNKTVAIKINNWKLARRAGVQPRGNYKRDY